MTIYNLPHSFYVCNILKAHTLFRVYYKINSYLAHYQIVTYIFFCKKRVPRLYFAPKSPYLCDGLKKSYLSSIYFAFLQTKPSLLNVYNTKRDLRLGIFYCSSILTMNRYKYYYTMKKTSFFKRRKKVSEKIETEVTTNNVTVAFYGTGLDEVQEYHNPYLTVTDYYKQEPLKAKELS